MKMQFFLLAIHGFKTMNCQQFKEQSLSSASPPPLPQKVMHRWKVVESASPPSHQGLRYGPAQ